MIIYIILFLNLQYYFLRIKKYYLQQKSCKNIENI